MRRFVAGVGAMTMLLLAACSADDGDRVTSGSDTIVLETSVSTTEAPTTDPPTTESLATDPSTTVATTESLAVAGIDGTVWDVTVDGVMFAHQNGSRRTKTDCAVVFGSVHLVAAPEVGAWPSEVLPVTLAAGAEPVPTNMLGACDLTMPDWPRGYFSFLLTGSTMPFAIVFRGDEFDGSTPPLMSIGGDQPVELSPTVLDGVPSLAAAASGPAGGFTQAADVETDYTWPAGQATVRQVGVLTVPVEGGWCTLVFASVTLVEGDVRAYHLPPNISVVVDGHMESWWFGGPPYICASVADGWMQDPLAQDVPNGTVFGVAKAFKGSTTAPVIQAVALPSGVEGSTFEWVFAEPIILDSPPPPPGG